MPSWFDNHKGLGEFCFGVQVQHSLQFGMDRIQS